MQGTARSLLAAALSLSQKGRLDDSPWRGPAAMNAPTSVTKLLWWCCVVVVVVLWG